MFLRAFKFERVKYIYKENVRKMLKDPNRKSLFLQFRELLWLTTKQKHWPHNYFRYRYYLNERDVKDLQYYIPGRLFDIMRAECINDYTCKDQCNDKIQFKRRLTSNGLPAAEAFGYFQRGKGFFSLDGQLIDEHIFLRRLEGEVVVKPSRDTSCGRGIIFLSIDQADAQVTIEKNKTIPLGELKDYLTSHHNECLLIERRLQQHCDLKAIYPHSINTVRIDSLRCLDGNIVTFNSYIRFGQKGRQVDNISGAQGGVAVPIDISTGQLRLIASDYYFKEFVKHPDTGYVFARGRIPYWNEIKETVCRAHEVFPRINSIGWDVGITPEGPALIEGNHDYDMFGMQSLNGGYLKNEVFTREILRYIHQSPSRGKYEKYFQAAA